MKRLVVVSVAWLVLNSIAGCGFTIVPRPVNPSDLVNSSDRSITIQRDTLSLSARVQDTAVGGYSFATPLTSFYISAVNNGPAPITIPLSSISLTDGQGVVYQAVSPDAVNAMFLPEFDYMVPFPYVSFLDVVSLESQTAASALQSEEPYAGRPLGAASIETPFTPLIKAGTRSAGVVFFEVDLNLLTYIQLHVSDPAGKAPFVFPFAIEK